MRLPGRHDGPVDCRVDKRSIFYWHLLFNKKKKETLPNGVTIAEYSIRMNENRSFVVTI
jgi:hypothetical protein